MGYTRIRVRPAEPGDRDQGWPLARDLATSYVVERPAFDRSFALLLAARRAVPFYQALGYEDSATYFKKPLGWAGDQVR